MTIKSFKFVLILGLFGLALTACNNSVKQEVKDVDVIQSAPIDSAQVRAQANQDTSDFKYINGFLNEVIYNGSVNSRNYEKYFDGRDEIDAAMEHYLDSGALKPYVFHEKIKDATLALDYFSWRMMSSCLSINREIDTFFRIKTVEPITVFKLEFKCGEVYYFVLNQNTENRRLLAIVDRAKHGLAPVDYSKKWNLENWK